MKNIQVKMSRSHKDDDEEAQSQKDNANKADVKLAKSRMHPTCHHARARARARTVLFDCVCCFLCVFFSTHLMLMQVVREEPENSHTHFACLFQQQETGRSGGKRERERLGKVPDNRQFMLF